MRLNTGRWNDTESFDDLMANKGIEPNLPGYTDDKGFEWVIDQLGRKPRASSSLSPYLTISFARRL